MTKIGLENYATVIAQHSAFLEKEKVNTWIQDALNKEACFVKVENIAAELIKNFAESQNPAPSSNSRRYQFLPPTKREELLRLLFDQALTKDTYSIIAAAEKVAGAPFYPTWKNICWIHIPQTAASIMGHPVARLAITVSLSALSYFAAQSAYNATQHLFIARAIPLIINHTPIQVIRMSNSAVDAINYVFKNSLPILLGIWLMRTIVRRLPHIPWLTSAIQRINLWNAYYILFNSPQTLWYFLIMNSIEAAKIMWNASESISNSLHEIAQMAKVNRLEISTRKTRTVWQQIIQESTPCMNI